MRIIVIGDRNRSAPQLAQQVASAPVRPRPGHLHGGATGIDRCFAEAVDDSASNRRPIPPAGKSWTHPEAVIRHDKRGRPYNANAGPIRNPRWWRQGRRCASRSTGRSRRVNVVSFIMWCSTTPSRLSRG